MNTIFRGWVASVAGMLVLCAAPGAFAQIEGGAGGADAGGNGGLAGDDVGGAAGAGVGGDSGLPNPGTGTKLGQACQQDQDCDDSAAPGLVCVTETETVLQNGAPPHGLCTAVCDIDDDCSSLSAGAFCYPFNDSAGPSYCIEGCFFGAPALGEQKCHGRPELACNPALIGDTGQPCASVASCELGELCLNGTCAVVFPGCLPSCRGDVDCADGLYCDQSFLSGVCVSEKPVGKGLGEACTVKAEPDECLGFCQADATGSTQGHCATTCGLASPCAWNSVSEKYDGVCFYSSTLTAEVGDVGDFGFCSPTCNCSDECGDPALECCFHSAGRLNDTFRGPGLCFSPDPDVPELDECSESQGGAGGDGSGGTSGSGGTRGPISQAGTGAAPQGGEGSDPVSGSADESSCGCKLAARDGGGAGAAWLLALALVLRRRRR